VTSELEFPPPFGAIELAKEQERNDGKLLIPFLKPEIDQRSSSMPAKVVMKCHTPFREIGNEASIRVPRMFKSHAWQQ
jgi:hypothetical protein